LAGRRRISGDEGQAAPPKPTPALVKITQRGNSNRAAPSAVIRFGRKRLSWLSARARDVHGQEEPSTIVNTLQREAVENTNLAALEDQFGHRAERRSSDHSEKPVPSN
jgi:hypothetical protein